MTGIFRSAVAKWEIKKGIPDVDNLKILSQLLGVSIDYLLDNGEKLDKEIIKESIDLLAVIELGYRGRVSESKRRQVCIWLRGSKRRKTYTVHQTCTN